METMEATTSRAYYKKEAYSNEEDIRPIKRSPRLTDETIRRKHSISKRIHDRRTFERRKVEEIAALERDAQAEREETLEEWAERVAAEYNDAAIAEQAKSDEEYRVWAEKQIAERQL